MNRRSFLEILAKGATLSLASEMLSLEGCSQEEKDISKTINIEGQEYSVYNGVITQLNNTLHSFKLGILADTHAHSDNTRFFADQLSKEQVNAFLLAGDLSWSFGDYEGSKDDYNEIVSVVKPVANTGKLVLVYPGNHEQKVGYSKALKSLTRNYKNVIDMERISVADFRGVTIVGLGGNDTPRFNVPEGYLRTKVDFDRLGKLAKQYQKDKPLLIATHIPQRYATQRGLDVAENGKINVGGIDLANIRKALNSKFGVSGHIHEAYGLITHNEESLKQGELADRLDINPGAVFDHLQRRYLKPAAGIVEFVGNQARGYIFNR